MVRRSSCLVFALIVLGSAAPAPAAEKLDKKRIESLAARWFAARPKTYFETWDPRTRAALLAEAEALGAIPEGSLDAVVALMWKAVKKNAPRFKPGKAGGFDTPYGKAWWLQSGSGGKGSGLVLSLHGGGPGAGSADSSWKLPKCMTMGPQGIKLIHDTWNSIHGERFLLTLIEIGKARHEVDPDRVFSMGFSMGGVGSWFMAGRHPDLLAGAIPAHGVIPCTPTKVKTAAEVKMFPHGFVPNVRNLAVYFYTGSEDVNCEPGTFLKAWELLQPLMAADPEGYKLIRFQEHQGVAHTFPPGEPGKGYQFMKERRRDTFPEKLVWEYSMPQWPPPDPEDAGKIGRFVKRWFYWLHWDHPVDRMVVTATVRRVELENVVDLQYEEKLAFQEDFTVYLNPQFINAAQETVVRVNGREVWRGTPKPNLVTVLESLDARLDRSMVFDRKIRLPEKD